MQTTFRNGIIQYQYAGLNPNAPTFLVKTAGSNYSVTLSTVDKDFIATASNGVAEYLITLFSDATGVWSFNDLLTHYLYIEIDKVTGAIRYGSSLFPVDYGPVFPSVPGVTQNFFNTLDNKNYEWSGSAWVQNIRVFVGQVSSVGVVPYTNGTSTGTNTPYITGAIIYSEVGRAILKGNKTFLTTADQILINNIPFGTQTLENTSVPARAMGTLSSNRFVKIDNTGYLAYAQPVDVGNYVLFLLQEPLVDGEVTNLPLGGALSNSSWNWSSANLPIWCGENGVVSDVDPVSLNPTTPSKPPIAKTVNATTIVTYPVISTQATVAPPTQASTQASTYFWQPNTIYDDTRIFVMYGEQLYRLYDAHTSSSVFEPKFWMPVESVIQGYEYQDFYRIGWYTQSIILRGGDFYRLHPSAVDIDGVYEAPIDFEPNDWIKIIPSYAPIKWIDITPALGLYAGTVSMLPNTGYIIQDYYATDYAETTLVIVNATREFRLPTEVAVDTVVRLNVRQRYLSRSGASVFSIACLDANIEYYDEDIVLDMPYADIECIFVGGNRGWKIIAQLDNNAPIPWWLN